MPLYEYKCLNCGTITDKVRSFAEIQRPVTCECGGSARKIISRPNLVTDTNFGYTGKYDPRLGGPKIEGRKDFWDRCAQQGLGEVDLKELANNPQTLDKRLKKRFNEVK